MQNKFGIFENMARQLTSSNYKECAERKRTRYSFADEDLDNTDPSLSLSASDKFRAQSFYPIIDRLTTDNEMTKKREAYKILCERFNFLLDRSMTRDELIHKAKELVNTYPSDLEDGFIEEFLLFSRIYEDKKICSRYDSCTSHNKFSECKHSIQNLSLHFRNKCGRRKKLLKDEIHKKLSPIYNGAATIVATFTTFN
jgi:hypothetical protein